MTTTFYVWFVTYGTHTDPDLPPWLIAGPMPLPKAFAEVKRLGFGYCVKEQAAT